MSVEENKALVRRGIEALNTRNWALVSELIAPNFLDHNPLPDQVPGVEGLKRSRTALHTDAFPDLKNTIEDVIAEGDKVVVRLTVSGTRRGEFTGIAPTNKRVSWTTIIIYRIVGGKLAERCTNTDTLGMMQQLGVVTIKTASK